MLQAAGAGSVLYASDYCHWDCHFPYSVKDVVDASDLNDQQRERILFCNAVDFFALKELPKPRALKIARESWQKTKSAVA